MPLIISALLLFAISASVCSEELQPLFHESFDSGKTDGVVGKAGSLRGLDARGLIDFDRGTLAFFMKSDCEPRVSEWNWLGGTTGMRGGGYWGMQLAFNVRRQDFLFTFHDIGRYGPPLHLEKNIGRWKAGQWHHLAAVWDRFEGINVYEDGKRVASNWGQHRWEWNLLPAKFSLRGTVDEVYVYPFPLTDTQIAQLAKGQKPSGPPISIASEEKRRSYELARMGWSGESLKAMPVVEAGKPQLFTFATITGCVDAKRPIAQPLEGFSRTTWPLIKYGASIRGRHLDIKLAPGQFYDRVRVFVHRRFEGRFMRPADGERLEELLPLQSDQATIWHRLLPELLKDKHLVLKRKRGRLGQIDFYRIERLRRNPLKKNLVSFSFRKVETLPDSEVGRALISETPSRFQQPLLGTQLLTGTWSFKSPAFGGFQATTVPLVDAKAFESALVELVVENLAEPTPIRIQIKEPVHGMRDWLVADAILRPRGKGRQKFSLHIKGRPVINMPPTEKKKYWKDGKYLDERIPVPGTAFGIKVVAANPVEWVMGNEGSSLSLVLTDKAKVLDTAAEFQEEVMREAYAEIMEGHAFGDKRIVIPLTWLTMFAPERMKVRQIYERVGSPLYYVGINVPKLVYKEPENTTGVPDWAFWQLKAMNEHRRLIHWRIDNQQLENGEYGGVWNDDSTHVENWIGYALCMDDDNKIKNSLRKFWDGNWNHLEEGVGKYTQDILHFFEEGTGGMAMRLLIDYGEPVAFSRCLAASSHYDKWLIKDEEGKYVRNSHYVSVNGAWTYGAFYDGKSYGSHFMVPAGYLIWYNRLPSLFKYFKSHKGRGGYFHGSLIDRVNGFEAGKKQYAEAVLKPLGRYGPMANLSHICEIGMSDAIRKAHPVKYTPQKTIQHYWGARNTDEHYWRFLLTGDERFLVDSYKRVCEWFYSHDWLNTGAMASMDRNPLPRYSLIRARMGHLAANRGASALVWPLYGISYEKGADQVAAIVTQNVPNKLTTRFYTFSEKPHQLQLRVWRLSGTFKATLYSDKDDDGNPDAGQPIMSKEIQLTRGSTIDLQLPPKQSTILSFTPIKAGDFNHQRPDPAISNKTCELVYGEHLVVRVHNLGSKPIEDCLVRVRDGRSGTIVVNGEKLTGRIEAPLDFKPKHKGVEFKNINANTYGSIIIEVDPDRKIDDLNPFNNRVVLEY